MRGLKRILRASSVVCSAVLLRTGVCRCLSSSAERWRLVLYTLTVASGTNVRVNMRPPSACSGHRTRTNILFFVGFLLGLHTPSATVPCRRYTRQLRLMRMLIDPDRRALFHRRHFPSMEGAKGFSAVRSLCCSWQASRCRGQATSQDRDRPRGPRACRAVQRGEAIAT
jgi:hypothetical protein